MVQFDHTYIYSFQDILKNTQSIHFQTILLHIEKDS